MTRTSKGRKWSISLSNGQILTADAVFRFREKAKGCPELTDYFCSLILSDILNMEERDKIERALADGVNKSGISRGELLKVHITAAWYALKSGIPKDQRGPFDPQFIRNKIQKAKGSAEGILLPNPKRKKNGFRVAA